MKENEGLRVGCMRSFVSHEIMDIEYGLTRLHSPVDSPKFALYTYECYCRNVFSGRNLEMYYKTFPTKVWRDEETCKYENVPSPEEFIEFLEDAIGDQTLFSLTIISLKDFSGIAFSAYPS